jgi:hypothetical protein
MAARFPFATRSLAVVQIAGAMFVFALLAVEPPARGTMMLVSLLPRGQAEITTLALSHGASLVQRGPLPSSLIVYGESARIAWPLAREGVLTLAGGSAGCRTDQSLPVS